MTEPKAFPAGVIDQDMIRRAIWAYEEATDDRLPDGDGADFEIMEAILSAALMAPS